MQVFKLYFKVFFKRVFIMFLAFLGLFVLLASIINSANSTGAASFEVQKTLIAVIDRDNSELSKHLSEYIAEKSTPVKLEDDEKVFRDALFFKGAEYILIIPDGFGENFESDSAISLESLKKPESISARIADVMINSYLDTAKLHINAGEKLDYDAIEKELSSESPVSIYTEESEADSVSDQSVILNYVNNMAYPLASILTFGIGFIMFVLSNSDVRKRNSCSPIKMTSYSFQIFLGNAVLAVFSYAALIVLSVIMLGDQALSKHALIMYLNMFMFTLSMLSLAFLFGNIVTSKNTVSILANSVSLGISFLGGVFISYEYLSDTVKKIDIINPAYWCVKANVELASVSSFTAETLSPLFTNIFIQLGYCAAFISIALLIYKQKRTAA